MSAIRSDSLSSAIKAKAFDLGFDFCRILPVQPPRHRDFFSWWLDQGFAADMDYLRRGKLTRLDPHLINPRPASVVVLATRYWHKSSALINHPISYPHNSLQILYGKIARYAVGNADYHDTIRPKINALDDLVRSLTGRPTSNRARGWVDASPVLERDFAEMSGIGYIGKNCCAIHSDFGSWFFIATLWLPEVLAYDDNSRVWPSNTSEKSSTLMWPEHWQDPHPQKSRVGSCGQCSRCLEACPTKALIHPYQLDARRCIAYWTIEHQGLIPIDLREHFGAWIFGCDICQEVCPWNHESPTSPPRQKNEQQPCTVPHEINLLEGFDERTPYWLDDTAFTAKFTGTPLMRPKRQGLLRNVCVALGNLAPHNNTLIPQVLDVLNKVQSLERENAVIIEHAKWAANKIDRSLSQ